MCKKLLCKRHCFNEALNDLYACRLSELLSDKKFVLDLIEGGLQHPLFFIYAGNRRQLPGFCPADLAYLIWNSGSFLQFLRLKKEWMQFLCYCALRQLAV